MNLTKSIQQILLASGTAVFAVGSLAGVGQQNPPPGPGHIPDYFGVVPNYANSPSPILAVVSGGSGTGAAATTYDYVNDVPTKYLMDIQGGTGYLATDTITIKDGAGHSCSATIKATSNISPTGAILPNVDSTGAFVSPGVDLLSCSTETFDTPLLNSGIRKFVDTLAPLGLAQVAPNNLNQILPIAVADKTTFPGSDYYEIAVSEYEHQFHSDLPKTTLRGYKQLNAPTGSDALSNHYLGPIIVAKKGQPVRIKFVNQLPTGASGKLALPVDTTYMGADGATDTDNRAAVHLHGGNTPWISDGTVRQWVKPNGEAGKNKGESVRDVPDMWFDTSGNIIASCAVKPSCTVSGATNNPGDGAMTYFFTNDQSARLMFYHDHAEGTTRLNVYNGEAAGFVLQDPTEQDLVNGTNISGNNPSQINVLPALADTIPLVIQEKTFVPNNSIPVMNFYGAFKSQLDSQDPTWRWGNTGKISSVYNGNGDLWVPHVFMPNQNPGDVSGANAVGRWDYGPWFWPPFVNIQNGQIANPYYDPNCNTTTSYCEGPYIPGVPNGSLTNVSSGGDATKNIQPTNGGVLDNSTGQVTESPSGTPEAFNDTPIVNGTAYPYMTVDPKPYRFRILSVGNDRMLNLSWVVAASKKSDNTALANSGTTSVAQICDGKAITSANSNVSNATTALTNAQSNVNNAKLASDASPTDITLLADLAIANNALTVANTVLQNAQSNLLNTQAVFGAENCTEVKMLPWNAAQDGITHFPSGWYTKQKAGVTFDGRPSGVFDPATRGPAMIQIGTEGGFLSSPVVIKNQPVNYEYNPKNILIGNVKEHALLLGPAERADVLVDFTHFAGSTLLLYNDSPAPMPAWDLRLDYYTGGFDNTDTGGAFSVVPGYGPNSRTLMQIRVTGTGGTNPVDDTGTINMTDLTTAVQTAFKNSQEPIVVPQSVYSQTYTGLATTFTDALGQDLSRISDTSLTYTPMDPLTKLPVTTGSLKFDLQPKSIIEDWTQNWGRMNALLGVEVPKTTALTAVSIPQAYVDPQTELVKITQNTNMIPISGTATDGTQIWKITHNGVDSHAIHFHLFHVQLVNRVGWDGAMYPPDANELGWKDTVKMHPLSDTIVALRPMTMTNLPFKVPNSHRLLMPNLAPNALVAMDQFNLDPMSGNASDVSNKSINFGWEYLWHCHILGHEENDMMRTISAAQPPEAPSMTTATGQGTNVTVNWTDNSIISNWVTIQRSNTSNFTPGTMTSFNVLTESLINPSTGKVFSKKECDLQSGCLLSYIDTSAPADASVYYRVMANNTVGAGDGKLDTPRNPDGSYGGTLPSELSTLVPGFIGYANVTANSDWSNTASRLIIPVAAVSPAILAFPNTTVNTTSVALTATLSNSGAGLLTINSIATSGAPFARPVGAAGGTCGASLNPGANCTINVTFAPTVAGTVPSGTLTITDNSNNVPNSTQTVSLSGTGTATVVAIPPTIPSVVRDNFNRANANTLGNTWQQNVTLSNAVLRINNNQATANLLFATGYAYSTTVGTENQGAGFTFVTAPINNTALFLKATGTLGGAFGSNQLQNAIRVNYSGGGVTVATTTNGNAINPTYTTVGVATSTGGNLASGNSLLAAVDNTGKVWVWKVVGTTTNLLTPSGVQLPNNALWTSGGGKVGMQLPNGARVDNFVAY